MTACNLCDYVRILCCSHAEVVVMYVLTHLVVLFRKLYHLKDEGVT
jgi:hypothetical protein